MANDWVERIGAAQFETTITIDGVGYERLSWGSDQPDRAPGEYSEQCRDRGVSIGQLHVPPCCLENCRSS